jgi:adenylate kinase family enzyme
VTAGSHFCVLGTSGAGKSRMASDISQRLGVPWIELDAIAHRAGWQLTPVDELRAELRDRLAAAETSHGGWVTDGNYRSMVSAMLAEVADTYVWLDYPRGLVMQRLLRRTLSRLVFRRELWNGNREHWTNLFRRDPDKNILIWAWTSHASTRAKLEAEAATSTATWVRLRRPRNADRWLASL